MKKKLSAIVLTVTLTLILLAIPVFAAESAPAPEAREKVIIYQSDFSSNPFWQTNNPTRYYWDAQKQKYHYFVQGGTGGYSYIPVKYDNGPFTLEYDWYPVETDTDTAFRFGLGSPEMDVTRGTNILSVFPNKKYGKLMGLQVITQSNNKVEVNSAHDSYGGPTVNFADTQSYHVVVRFNDALRNCDIKVSYKDNQTTVWGYYVNLGQDLYFMNRLYISSVGEYGSLDNAAEGYIGNLTFYTYKDITPTPATPIPTVTTPVIPPTTAPATTAPTPTTAPVALGTLVISITAAVFLCAGMRKKS
jgi:hypothetical protein